MLDRIPTEPELAPGRSHFALIRIQVSEIDWLRLNSGGNLRARFAYEDNNVRSEWLAP